MSTPDRAPPPPPSSPPTSPFLLTLCPPGAEPALKREAQRVGLQLSFSRAGFVTFKASRPVTVDDAIPSVLTQLEAVSLGALDGDLAKVLAEKLSGLTGVRLHVMDGPVDRPAILAACGALFVDEVRPEPGDLVATIIPVDQKVWLSLHRHRAGRSPFPGGVATIACPESAPSRGYVKLEEAIARFGLDLRRGEHAIELGCAPGGAALALLSRGLHVVGIDPTRPDPSILAHRHFKHIRETTQRANPRWVAQPVDWLLLDVNVPPGTAIRGAARFLELHQDTLRGLIFTLKLQSFDMIDEVDRWLDRILEFAPDFDLQVGHLSSGAQELCVVGTRRGR